MKKLVLQLIQHIREDFDPVVYGGTVLWLAILVTGNYQFNAFDSLGRGRDLADLPSYFALYAVPWLVVLGLLMARGRLDTSKPGFWRHTAVALCIVAFVDWFPYHYDLIKMADRPLRGWLNDVLWNVKSTVTWFTPMFVFWWLYDRQDCPNLYGWSWARFDPKPYLMCLGIVIPLTIWASFQPSFLAQYPTYRPGNAEVYLGIPAWPTVLIYELFYGFDFSFVEMYFRGFLVIGLARWLGRSAVLPMVAMYAVLHFGKPFWETIGSIVGGYILGVFAYETRSIYGGIMLHVGLAWSMETTAFMQRWLR